MYLNVASDDSLTLHEPDDFKRFHISKEAGARDLAGNPAFQEIAEDAGDGHYWLDADAIVALSGRRDDEGWKAAYWSMLEKAEPHGFADTRRRRIKAHVVQDD